MVSPPTLLDSSALERSTLSSPDLQDHLEPDKEQQAEDAAVVRSTEGTQPQLGSDQSGPSGSSVNVTTAIKTIAGRIKKKRET